MVFGEARCMMCGVSFRYPRDYGVVRYCSALCRVNHMPPQHPWEYKGCAPARYYNKRRRRKMRGGDRIDPLVIYIAFNWTCVLCSAKIDPELVSPDPMCASIDHVVPLGRGGRHVWQNLVPMHKRCNEEKDRL